jgi:glycosyltransferase involved in cell wall biosynthesis
MLENALISIVMSTYNDSLFIKNAIESVVNQSYTNLEFIIIDDGSTDGTKRIIKKYQKTDKRIKYFKNNNNQGLIYSLNRGIKLAKGEYIARIDSDDKWIDKNKLKKQVEYLNKNKNVVLVGTWAYKTNRDGKILHKLKYPTSDKDIRKYMIIENCFIHSSVMIRKTALPKEPYDKEFKCAEDYGLWLRLGTLGKLKNIPEYMVNYTINPRGISQSKYNIQLKSTIKAIKKYKKSYPFYLLGLILWYLRIFIKREIREFISNQFRKLIIANT